MATREREFLSLYQKYRYDDQLDFYDTHVAEFKKAQAQAKWGGIGLMTIATLAGAVASFSPGSPLRPISLVIAAFCLILYTGLTAYTALYAFDQQKKLYEDTAYKLSKAHTMAPDVQGELSEQEFAEQLRRYVSEVEDIYHTEQGQWGQLAGEMMRPPQV